MCAHIFARPVLLLVSSYDLHLTQYNMNQNVAIVLQVH